MISPLEKNTENYFYCLSLESTDRNKTGPLAMNGVGRSYIMTDKIHWDLLCQATGEGPKPFPTILEPLSIKHVEVQLQAWTRNRIQLKIQSSPKQCWGLLSWATVVTLWQVIWLSAQSMFFRCRQDCQMKIPSVPCTRNPAPTCTLPVHYKHYQEWFNNITGSIFKNLIIESHIKFIIPKQILSKDSYSTHNIMQSLRVTTWDGTKCCEHMVLQTWSMSGKR